MTERTWFKTEAGKALVAAAKFVKDETLKAAMLAEAEAAEVAREATVVAPTYFAPETREARYVTRIGPGGDEVQVRVY